MLFRSFFLVIVGIILFTSTAHAIREPRPMALDKRFKVITYHPNDVHKLTFYYEYQSSIVLEAGETVKTISMGDTSAWNIVDSDNRIFIKPVEDNATTNMTLITNKRVYYIELHAEEVDPDKGIEDEDLVFVLRFVYPGSPSGDGAVQRFSGASSGPDLSQPEKYNFNYTVSGSDYISPIRIFDDGEFTYFQFTNQNADVPAFFLVDSEGKEGLVNYRIQGDYVVVERVGSVFTLRNGTDTICVFNESRKMRESFKF